MQKPDYLQNLVDQTRSDTKNIDRYVRTLVYGEFGAGKTHFAATFPNPLFIDTDHGMVTTRNPQTGQTPFAIRFEPGEQIYAKIMGLLGDLAEKRGPFAEGGQLAHVESVVLDGVTTLVEDLLQEIVLGAIGNTRVDASEFKPQFEEWMMLKSKAASILNTLKTIPYHVCLTAMAKIDKDEADGRYIGMFDVLGSTRDVLGRLFNEIYFVEKRRANPKERETYGSEAVHEFYTVFHPRFKVKSRLGEKSRIPAKALNPTFDSLYGRLYKKDKA